MGSINLLLSGVKPENIERILSRLIESCRDFEGGFEIRVEILGSDYKSP